MNDLIERENEVKFHLVPKNNHYIEFCLVFEFVNSRKNIVFEFDCYFLVPLILTAFDFTYSMKILFL